MTGFPDTRHGRTPVLVTSTQPLRASGVLPLQAHLHYVKRTINDLRIIGLHPHRVRAIHPATSIDKRNGPTAEQ